MKKRVKKTKKNFLSSIKPKKSNLIYWIVGVIVVILLIMIIPSGKKESNLEGELASLSGNSLNLINFSIPAQVNLGQVFQIGCNFGEYLPCIAAVHNNNVGCSWAGWKEGTTVALFNCIANRVGNLNNSCNLFYYEPDGRCHEAKEFQIDKTRVIGSDSVSLINFSIPAQVNLGQSFQIGCNFGERLPCIAATHANRGCSWHGWGQGTTALFNCTANALGIQKNTCNLFNYSADSRCVARVDIISSTAVLILNSTTNQTNQTG